MKLMLAIAVAGIGAASQAQSQAMWEISDRWNCTLDYQMILNPPAAPEVTGRTGSFRIDFGKGTVGSAFTDSFAQIVQRYHYSSSFGDQTVLVQNWGGDHFSITYVEGAGGFLTTSISSSGGLGADRWAAMSFCLPE